MRTMAIVVVAMLLASRGSAQQLTDAEVLQAIQAGEANKFNGLISLCYAHSGMGEGIAASLAGGVQADGGYSVVFARNQGYIATLAKAGKRLYKKVTPDAISDELRTPMVFVSIEPERPTRSSGSNKISVSSPVEHVVLKSKVGKDPMVVQPAKFDASPVEWTNLLGGKVESTNVIAVFNVNDVIELTAGDFDVVVVTKSGERRCKIGTKDRATLRLAK